MAVCWCRAANSDWVVDRYVAMRDALNKTGRPMLFSLCEWGVANPWLWGQEARSLLPAHFGSNLRCHSTSVLSPILAAEEHGNECARCRSGLGCLGIFAAPHQVGNSWRTTGDITPHYDSLLRCLDNSVGLARHAGPGAWNDADLLEVNSPTLHFAPIAAPITTNKPCCWYILQPCLLRSSASLLP